MYSLPEIVKNNHKGIRTSNGKCSKYVNNRIVFNANNIFSEVKNNCYVVYSYGYHFPMYVFRSGKWYANKDKYSITTSSQQTQSKPDNIDVYVKTEVLKDIINNISDIELAMIK